MNKVRRLEKGTDRFEDPRDKRVTGESGSLANEPCVSSGDAGHGIQIFETSPWYKPASERLETLEQIPLMSIKADDEAYINDIALSPDGKYVYGE